MSTVDFPLPPELVDIVIGHLHGDIEALSACSLVCMTWFPSARYHLFYSFTISCRPYYSSPEPPPFERLVKILELDISVRQYIKQLHLTDQNGWGSTKDFSVALLVQIFERLPSLRTLLIDGVRLPLPAEPHEVANIPPLSIRTLCFISPICTLPQLIDLIALFGRIDNLCVYGMNVPLDEAPPLRHSLAVKSLLLEGARGYPCSQILMGLPSIRRSLESLDWTLSPLEVNPVGELREFGTFLHNFDVASTLRHFRIDVSSVNMKLLHPQLGDQWGKLNLSSCFGLESVHISIFTTHLHPTPEVPDTLDTVQQWKCLLAILQTIPRTVKRITVGIHGPIDQDDLPVVMAEIAWYKLDELLDEFRSLERVMFQREGHIPDMSLPSFITRKALVPAWRDTLQTRLPSLFSRGCMRFL